MVHRRFRAAGTLALTVLMGFSAGQSQSQEYAYSDRPPHLTVPLKISARPNPNPDQSTNSISATTAKPHPYQEISPAKINLETRDETSLAFIVEKVGTDRANAGLTSARLFAEDSLVYMNRESAVLENPYHLTNRRGATFFGNTALQSAGDYLEANEHPEGIVRFIQESLLDNPFDKRIISPLSPPYAGNPGEAYARKGDIHLGLRDLASVNPRGFITFSDKAEIDVTPGNPSFVLRNPFHADRGTELITALAVNYPDWQVTRWSLPRIGTTLAYVHGRHGIYLTTSAGRSDFESSPGHFENRYEARIMIYTGYSF